VNNYIYQTIFHTSSSHTMAMGALPVMARLSLRMSMISVKNNRFAVRMPNSSRNLRGPCFPTVALLQVTPMPRISVIFVKDPRTRRHCRLKLMRHVLVWSMTTICTIIASLMLWKLVMMRWLLWSMAVFGKLMIFNGRFFV
jgi:hypothetical protein